MESYWFIEAAFQLPVAQSCPFERRQKCLACFSIALQAAAKPKFAVLAFEGIQVRPPKMNGSLFKSFAVNFTRPSGPGLRAEDAPGPNEGRAAAGNARGHPKLEGNAGHPMPGPVTFGATDFLHRNFGPTQGSAFRP
jgi:hypothetical protein